MTTLKYHNAFPAAFLLVLALIGGSTVPIAAHPLGGVLQKTVVSNLSNAILIEYNTHFGPEVVLTLHPDKNFNGVLDEEERIQFLDRVNHLLLPNIICRLGTTKLTIEEMDRKLTLEDAGDFKNGLNSQFVWRVSLNKDGKPPEGLFRMQDNNFRASELNQLSYFVTILGDTGPVALADEGRELLWEVSSPKQPAPGSQLAAADTSLPGAGPPVGAMKNQETTNTETDTLRSLLRDSSGSLGLYLFGLVTAFILGAFHGLSPGHGKAMVAAYQ